MLNINLSHNQGEVIDNTILRFDDGQALGKFTLHKDGSKLYIPQGGKDYAIACAEGQGEMPLNFKASENGIYTITVNTDNVEMSYLHLIDNMTGNDVDLLTLCKGGRGDSNPVSYTFTAKTTDYESRFKLVFVANNGDDASTDSATFAFYSNGNWIIANEGQATLQVIDITGRILSSETVNGSVSKDIYAVSGMYMIRLINGDDVRTQKIIIE
jgi:hypothetical protein